MLSLVGFIGYTQRETLETWPVIGEWLSEPEPVEVHIPLDEFLLNSTDQTGAGRIVKLEVAVGSDRTDIAEQLTMNAAKIRESVIYVVSNETTDGLVETSSDAFIVSEKIKTRINDTVGDDIVDNVYILNLLIQ